MAKRKNQGGKQQAASATAPALSESAGKPAKRARFSNPSPAKSAAPPAKVANGSGQTMGSKGKAKAAEAPAPPSASSTPPAPRTFVVSAGSYERLLYGISCTFVPTPAAIEGKGKKAAVASTDDASRYTLAVNPIFSFPAHMSSLRALATSTLQSAATGSERRVGGKYLVSGGTDEIIKVWDLKRRKEVGTLDGDTNGNITCLRFVAQRNQLLVATTDSTIALYRVRDWVYLRALKGHKGRVNSIDAHPAGRVALSVGQDKNLRMWDLVAGKAVATLKVGEEGDVVKWNTDGTKFAVICNNTLTLYALDMTVLRVLKSPSRFHDVRFCYFPLDAADPTQREFMFVACEDGKTRVFDITTSGSEEDSTPVALLGGHSNRVKQLDLLEVAYPPETPDAAPSSSTIVLTSISSDGKINLYDLSTLASVPSVIPASADDTPTIPPVANYDSDGSRLTCVTAVGLVDEVGKKVRAEMGAEVDGESESESSEEEEGGSDDDEEEMSGEEIAFNSDDELEFDEDEEEDEEEGESEAEEEEEEE